LAAHQPVIKSESFMVSNFRLFVDPPALAAGCTMVLKPSEVSPLSAMIWAKVMEDAGVPPGVFNLVNGDGATVGAALSSH
jgi:acyl-CoA reductase-like NAD-dependent aldehyde dehydrogenase